MLMVCTPRQMGFVCVHAQVRSVENVSGFVCVRGRGSEEKEKEKDT